MAVDKIDPKVIFASEAPLQDTPAVFSNKTIGWGETRKNGGRPTIKQANALQKETDLKILWLNENAVLPYDATISYPVNAVTIKDNEFKIYNGTAWELFLNKSSVGLSNVDNTADSNKPISAATQTALNLKADTAYVDDVLSNKTHNSLIDRNVANSHTTAAISHSSGETQKQINDYIGTTWYARVGGYDVNDKARLTNGDIVQSTVEGNTVDPNTDMTGWVLSNSTSRIIDPTSDLSQLQININNARRVNKQRINISSFGNTGTQTTGSNEAWDNAQAFAKSIAPLITNNIGQSWFDLSGFEFVADGPVYPATPLALRSTYGVNLNFNIILPDNFVSPASFAINTSIAVSADNSLNRRPLNTSMYGNINCRYKGSGIYLNDFLHFTLHGNIYNFVSRGVETGTSGNEFIQMPQSTIGQWQYTAGGAADVPAGITNGTAVDINCGDCILLGIISYYITRGVRVNGRSCFIGAGAHIYGDRKQALLQTTSGGNLLLDGVWFDSSRVELVAEAQMRNCRVYLSSSDSTIGVIINGGVEVSVEGNVFLGVSSGTTAVFRDAAALAEKTCVVHNNKYWDGIANNEKRNLAPTVRGETTVGTATYTNQSGIYTHSGDKVDFTMRAAWSASDGAGNLIVAGLPFTASQNCVFPVMSVAGSLAPIVAYILAGSSQIRFRDSSGVTQIASSGDLYISGSYFI